MSVGLASNIPVSSCNVPKLKRHVDALPKAIQENQNGTTSGFYSKSSSEIKVEPVETGCLPGAFMTTRGKGPQIWWNHYALRLPHLI